MEASRDLQSQMTSLPSTPLVEKREALPPVTVWMVIWVMAFWWVDCIEVSAVPVVARLSRPLNFSMALRERKEPLTAQGTSYQQTDLKCQTKVLT